MPVPVPTPQQLAWQRASAGMFCHFGINTFAGREWSDGTLNPRTFDPTDLDADQWAEAAAGAGMRYLIFTAKHHDGFCLWQTDTTTYGVANSPWRDGRGDVVADLAAACQRAGIGLGLYLSPWDRNAACYIDAAAYDKFYCRQLTELCTRYGPLFEVWFDGAGSEHRSYDWDAVMNVLDRLQPGAMVFNLGRPTIRWVGNEDGLATDPVHYAVASTAVSVYADAEASFAGERYVPPECDVAIRRNWFWQPDDLATLKSVQHLLGVYYQSVGLGTNLLLNVPPDRRGRLDSADTARLADYGSELRRRFAAPVIATLGSGEGIVLARFDRPTTFDHIELREDLASGQRIDRHELFVDGSPLAAGRTVGVRRIHPVAERTASEIAVRIDHPEALAELVTYHTGHSTIPELGPLQTADPDKAL